MQPFSISFCCFTVNPVSKRNSLSFVKIDTLVPLTRFFHYRFKMKFFIFKPSSIKISYDKALIIITTMQQLINHNTSSVMDICQCHLHFSQKSKGASLVFIKIKIFSSFKNVISKLFICYTPFHQKYIILPHNTHQ